MAVRKEAELAASAYNQGAMAATLEAKQKAEQLSQKLTQSNGHTTIAQIADTIRELEHAYESADMDYKTIRRCIDEIRQFCTSSTCTK